MSWPIPVFPEIKYPKPMSFRVWFPTLVAIASGAATAVLLVWPHGKPTNTLQFWVCLVGAPLVACSLVFGWKLNEWEDEQTDAEEREKENIRCTGLWRDWSRRQICVSDVAAFPAATEEIVKLADNKNGLPTRLDRAVGFDWADDLTSAFRSARLLRLVARRFAERLRGCDQVIVTLMLDDASLRRAETWAQQAARVFGAVASSVTFDIEVRSAVGGVEWIARQVDVIDTSRRLVIAAQLWLDGEVDHSFSEGAAAFFVDPGVTKTGLILRSMESARDTLETGLTQIREIQLPPDQLAHVWTAGCDEEDSSVLRKILKKDPKESITEYRLDDVLGTAGPASSWITLAIAMEAMRGGGPQLVAWREPGAQSLYLCTVSPMPEKETTV